MTDPTITDLRHRAWNMANKSIDTLNILNDAIYKDSSNNPAKIDNIIEDLNNITLLYIQDGIDVFNNQLNEISQKKDYLISMQNKHQECVCALKQILG